MEGILSKDIQTASELLKEFLESDFELPEWNFCLTENKLDLSNEFVHLDQISQFDLYRSDNKFVISRYIRGMITSSLLTSSDFLDSTLYYSPDIENFNIRDITVPLNQGYRYRLAYCRSIMLHASAVVYDGGVILFTGISGAGKSTQAELWKKYKGTEILNYDQVIVFLDGKNVMACGTPWAGKEDIYVPGKYPVKAIVLIEKANYNKAFRLSEGEAFSNIYLTNYLYPLNDIVEEKYNDSISRLVMKVPVFLLQCNVSEDAVKTLHNYIFKK